jgi:hypothetical protein
MKILTILALISIVALDRALGSTKSYLTDGRRKWNRKWRRFF